jgi:hypothetical protein
MHTIAFQILLCSVRGTEISTYDYACANEDVLNNKSIIVIANRPDNNLEVIKKFASRFPVFFYNSTNAVLEIETILSQNNCKILYTICYGERRVNEPTLSINNLFKSAIHCVFSLADKHGDSYVPISKYLAEKYNMIEYVPHIVNKPNIITIDFRKKIGIPKSALVFGRHGGQDTFDLYFVYLAIGNVSKSYSY